MNKFIFTGRLGQDPEVNTAASGTKYARFSVAVNSGWGDNQRTDWFRCTAFSKTAEAVEKYLKKGSHVLIEGEVQLDSYQNKTYPDVTMTSAGVIVRNIEFLDPKEQTTTAAAQPQAQPQPQASTVEQDAFGDDLPF